MIERTYQTLELAGREREIQTAALGRAVRQPMQTPLVQVLGPAERTAGFQQIDERVEGVDARLQTLAVQGQRGVGSSDFEFALDQDIPFIQPAFHHVPG